MNILNSIIVEKKVEIDRRKKNMPESDLLKMPLFDRSVLSFKEYLLKDDKTGIIAEFKRRSPSKGVINKTALVEEVTFDYSKYGACAISVLTDEIFFGGSLNDLVLARANKIPLLRKDFIIDEYQLVESKAFGADIILLIAACLTKEEVKILSSFAKNIGLNVILEIHAEHELAYICDDVDVVGINNRNLKNFAVDVNHSIALGNKIPAEKIKIAESGIDNAETIHFLKKHGFQGFLMGEKFMKEKNPGLAFKKFAEGL